MSSLPHSSLSPLLLSGITSHVNCTQVLGAGSALKEANLEISFHCHPRNFHFLLLGLVSLFYGSLVFFGFILFLGQNTSFNSLFSLEFFRHLEF